MNVAQLKSFCRQFPGASETLYTEPYNFLVYTVGGKKFAYFKTSHPERWRFSMKVTPDRFVELTDLPGVKPARYRARFGWITIVNVSGFPALYLRELVEWSYHKALTSLSKADRLQFASQSDRVSGDMLPRKESPRSVRIVGGLLAAVWVGAGLAALVIAVTRSRWLLAAAGLAALWLGVLWMRVVRQGRRLTVREALTPWRAEQGSDGSRLS